MVPSSPERRVFATSSALKTQHGRETLRWKRKDRTLVTFGEHVTNRHRVLRCPYRGGGSGTELRDRNPMRIGARESGDRRENERLHPE
jgi:hypothetical protein